MPTHPRVIGVCGNPSPGSRTLSLTAEVLASLTGATGPLPAADTQLLDLSALGGKVLAWGDPEADATRDLVRGAALVVVSTPVYKGSLTGLLKGFLDGFDLGELAGTLAVPVTVAAAPFHALAGPTHLEPVLREIGFLVPGGTLHVPDKSLSDPGQRADLISAWTAPRHALLTTAGEGIAA